MTKPINSVRLVGVAGGSASGKTTLCRRIQELAGAEPVALVALDSYYHCCGALSPSERERVNYDRPEAIDHELLIKHAAALRNGSSVNVPCYDFAQHVRSAESTLTAAAPLVLVEGILALYWPRLRELFDLKVFLEAPEELRFGRRVQRDVRERGRTEASVGAQWQATVQASYESYCAPTRRFADFVVNGTADFDEFIRSRVF